MELLFTKGIKGIIDNSNILLLSRNETIETGYSYIDENILKLEEEYNIKLLGEITDNRLTNGLLGFNDFNFLISNGSCLISISHFLYVIDDMFVNIFDILRDKIFPNKDEYYSIYNKIPIFITNEGLVPDSFCKKEEFQNLLIDPGTWKFIDNKTKNKLIYMYDLFAMIGDIQTYVLNLHYNLIEAAKELFRFSNNIDPVIEGDDREQREYYEYKYSGYYPQIICSMYMNVIIQLNSCLDLIAKFFCEISNIPDAYEKPIKFKSGNIYFSDIKRFQEKFKNYKGYVNSILEQCNNYNDLVLSRHLIVHNSFFSSSPMIFYGYATPVVNYKKIYYSVMYIWDVDKEGRPERWLNRCKFYGQNRIIDDYIIKYLIEFYEQLRCTLELIESYLANKV